MASISTITVVGLAILVAPGFIAVLIASSIGVIEREPSRFKLLVASLVSSLLIDAIFLGIYQEFYAPVNNLSQVETLFFSPQFRLDLVAIYLLIAIALGAIYSLELIFEVRSKIQHLMWSAKEYRRHRRQPWEGAMDKAAVVRVKTTSDARIIGSVKEYSRAEKPHELWLNDVHWIDRDTGEVFSDGVSESVVLMENDIERVVVLDSDGGT
jgi:competence protein ComGF